MLQLRTAKLDYLGTAVNLHTVVCESGRHELGYWGFRRIHVRDSVVLLVAPSSVVIDSLRF